MNLYSVTFLVQIIIKNWKPVPNSTLKIPPQNFYLNGARISQFLQVLAVQSI